MSLEEEGEKADEAGAKHKTNTLGNNKSEIFCVV